MPAFIENPRRAPRIPIRCDARLALRSGSFLAGCTLDVGPGGCGVEASPSPLTVGERAFLEIDLAGTRYRFAGRVAWSSTAPPGRSGIAFDESGRASATALFTRLASALPNLADEGRTVERIQEDAFLAPTPAPGSLRAVSREEEILLAIGGGLEARALRDRLGGEWNECVNAVFALLERGAIQACAPEGGPAGATSP